MWQCCIYLHPFKKTHVRKSLFCAQNYNSLEFNCHQISFPWTPHKHLCSALFLKSCSVFVSDTKPLFACNFPHWYQRLNGKRADQVLSVLDKLINVSQFIIRDLSSPCQVANGNINHRHSPSRPFSHLCCASCLCWLLIPKYHQAQTDLSGTNVKHNSAQE